MLGHNDNVEISLDTSQIRTWRSILTLIVFLLANLAVIFPFHIPIYVPRPLSNAFLKVLRTARVLPPFGDSKYGPKDGSSQLARSSWVRLRFPINFLTAPLIAALFLLAIGAIHRAEVKGGTLGANNISPLDIMIFFLSLAYIAISIDASGLLRYSAFKLLQWGGGVGQRLFFYLYIFFFLVGSFVGNDPIVLSGTAFLAYMTRISQNIEDPRAWIFTEFAVANIASAILVSSNPTNLVLAGAFDIKFVVYTANMIVPVVVTGIVLFPFLLYVVFTDESLIPISIELRELSDEAKEKEKVNPNIPFAQVEPLEEVLNPFLDKWGAGFGAFIMASTLIVLLAVNAAKTKIGEFPVFYITLPAAVVMFIWDVIYGWRHRHTTREISRKGRQEMERAKREREEKERSLSEKERSSPSPIGTPALSAPAVTEPEKVETRSRGSHTNSVASGKFIEQGLKSDEEKVSLEQERKPHASLYSIIADSYRWCQETFPTATAVMNYLPFALVPFAFCMFVLVQGLVTKGWVPVFAYGWDHWVSKTGTVGAVGGMGFLAVILSNFTGTNIGTTILLSRVVQAWQQIHRNNGTHISDRTFWATVYSMALGVNYGAFSAAFSASLAGLLWRDILLKKDIRVGSLDFARVNLPIIAISMIVGSVVLIGEVYIMRGTTPYDA